MSASAEKLLPIYRAGSIRVIERQPTMKPGREKWDSDLEYITSVLGFAAGFGSIWRFPYLIWSNGGGVFLIPYFICLLVLGIPFFYLEVALGQLYQEGCPKIFEKIHKKWKGLGIVTVLICLNMSTYYNLLEGYSFLYFFQSFKNPLPWESEMRTGEKIFEKSAQFYKIDVQKRLLASDNEIGSLNGNLYFYYVLSMIFVFAGIAKGIKFSGKVTVYTATSPYILLIILLFRAFFLDGAGSGVSYLLNPDLSKLFTFKIWSDAAIQIAFQMSVGCGVLTLYGSYREKHENILKSSILIPGLVVLCGLLAAFTVFCYMGYMAKSLNIDIKAIPLAGPDLAFIAYPAALTLMPFSNLWAILFFAMMILLGIDTMFGLVECVAAFIEDEGNFYGKYKISQWQNRAICSAFICIFGVLYCTQGGYYYLNLVDTFTCTLPLLATCLAQSYFFSWAQSFDDLEILILEHTKMEVPKFIKDSIRVYSPILLTLLLLIGFFEQVKYSFSLSFFDFILGWFICLYPYLITWKIFQNNKNIMILQSYSKADDESRLKYIELT